ncbi:MAG: hypothetical protein M0Z84_04680 [Gammaproteobacteria bacterium]|nr:hypothetical protein [Gammaproteobacteria bacterium]
MHSNPVFSRLAIAFLAASLLLGWVPAAAGSAGPQLARRWSLVTPEGLAVEFVQRPLDLTEAFFQGRGFTPAVSRQIANACVLAVVVSNRSASTIFRVDLGDWRVQGRDVRPQQLRLDADWQRAWKRMRIARAQRIAFRYAMLPTRQVLRPGDRLQGMITTNLSTGQRFDMNIRWEANGEPGQAWLRGLACAMPSQRGNRP